MSANLQVFLQAFLPYFFEFLGVALGLVGIWAVHKIATKFHVEATTGMDQRIWDAAHNAVTYAEAWAAKQVKVGEPKPNGTEKMQAALDFLTAFINQKQLDKLGKEKLIRILETSLHVQRPPSIQVNAPVEGK